MKSISDGGFLNTPKVDWRIRLVVFAMGMGAVALLWLTGVIP